MTARLITLTGCDESTTFVVDGLTGADVALLDRVAALSREASPYDCFPRMSVQPAEDEIRQ